MKKKKFLATILIASSAFLGTGYSWWTDGLKVEGVISTGEFKVVGVGATTTKEIDEDKITTILKLKSVDGIQGFSYIIEDLYPNESYEFMAMFENQGSIPAKVADVVIKETIEKKSETEDNVLKHLQVTGAVKVIDQSANKDEKGKYIPVREEYEYVIKENPVVTVYDLEEILLSNIKDWQLDKRQSIVFENFKVELIDAYYSTANKDNPHNLCEGFSVQFDLNLLFNQHNQK